MRIFLIGFMGCGKTTLGKKLAKTLNYNFIDLDSYIDLPDQLIPSVLHYTLGHFLAIDGQLQIASGHRGLARQIEQEYVETISTREAKPDIIPPPLQDFL